MTTFQQSTRTIARADRAPHVPTLMADAAALLIAEDAELQTTDLIPSLPRLSRAFDSIVAASSSAVVELSHAVGSFFLPAELLCRVSPVFMGWLSDSDGDDHVITVDGSTFSELQAFVALILAWPFYQGHTALRMAEAPYSLGELARGSHRSVNLVHKYDCRALMDLLRLALNARPSATGLLAALKLECIDGDASYGDTCWLGRDALDCLVEECLPGSRALPSTARDADSIGARRKWSESHTRAHFSTVALGRLKAMPGHAIRSMLLHLSYQLSSLATDAASARYSRADCQSAWGGGGQMMAAQMMAGQMMAEQGGERVEIAGGEVAAEARALVG